MIDTAEVFGQRLDTIKEALGRLHADVQSNRERLLTEVIEPVNRELFRIESILREIAAMREH